MGDEVYTHREREEKDEQNRRRDDGLIEAGSTFPAATAGMPETTRVMRERKARQDATHDRDLPQIRVTKGPDERDDYIYVHVLGTETDTHQLNLHSSMTLNAGQQKCGRAGTLASSVCYSWHLPFHGLHIGWD